MILYLRETSASTSAATYTAGIKQLEKPEPMTHAHTAPQTQHVHVVHHLFWDLGKFDAGQLLGQVQEGIVDLLARVRPVRVEVQHYQPGQRGNQSPAELSTLVTKHRKTPRQITVLCTVVSVQNGTCVIAV